MHQEEQTKSPTRSPFQSRQTPVPVFPSLKQIFVVKHTFKKKYIRNAYPIQPYLDPVHKFNVNPDPQKWSGFTFLKCIYMSKIEPLSKKHIFNFENNTSFQKRINHIPWNISSVNAAISLNTFRYVAEDLLGSRLYTTGKLAPLWVWAMIINSWHHGCGHVWNDV